MVTTGLELFLCLSFKAVPLFEINSVSVATEVPFLLEAAMSRKVNTWKEQVAMYFLSIGVIEVSGKGYVWKAKDKCGIPYIWNEIEPRRAESNKVKDYLRVPLRLNGKSYYVYAHRIVYLALKGLIPEGLQINHKNGVRDDNRPENLELMTPSENIIHGLRVLGSKRARGEQQGNSKLKEYEVLQIRKIYSINRISFEKLGKMFNTSKSNVRDIINRRNWKHI